MKWLIIIKNNIRSEDQLLEHRISVWVGSWNVGNSVPCTLDDWLPVNGDYDIIAVGTQVNNGRKTSFMGSGMHIQIFYRV